MDAVTPVNEPHRLTSASDVDLIGDDGFERYKKLARRAAMGLLLGVIGGPIVLFGGLPFAALVAAGAYLAYNEYKSMVM